jgi:hypothetical protein
MTRSGGLVLSLGLLACGSPAASEDAAVTDASVDAAVASRPVLYPADRTQSPLTPDLVQHLRTIRAASSGSDMVFAKIGDSHTISPEYVTCFASTPIDLGGRDLTATVAYFAGGDAAGTTPYERVSVAAMNGWSAFQALAGSPSPIESELTAINPAFATVMFGTNDIGYDRIDRFGQNLITIADLLVARGIVPVFSTIPPRDDEPAADLLVPRYDAMIRAVAQTRGLPLLDLHRELIVLPQHGIGPDGVHLESYSGGACIFDATGLQHGNNVRNLATIEALDRLRRTLISSEPAPDATAPRLRGEGTATLPYLVEAFPFADRRDTRTDGENVIASYPACGATNEMGAEVYYRVDLAAAGDLHAAVIDGPGDIDLQLLRDQPDAAACVAHGDIKIDMHLDAGTYYLVVDTYADQADDYVLAVDVE